MDEEIPRKRTARFPVTGVLDGAGGRKDGTVLIDRENKTFSVRPKRSHTTYTLTLGEVADMVCRSIILGKKKST